MNIFLWILFGSLVGIAAYALDTGSKTHIGILSAIILGVLGTFVGGFLGNFLFGVASSGYNLSSFFIAAFSAIVILFVGRTMQQEVK